jgi:hypothetical protein
MKGSVAYETKVKKWYVAWYHAPERKTYKIYYYKGLPLLDKGLADKLLASMQGDYENGTFRVEKYTRMAYDVIPYLQDWLKAVRHTLSPATLKDYANSLKNHIIPFFETKAISLHEIQFDTLMELLGHIKRDGKGKMNVMYCLHACLDYAWRSGRIPAVPPFPKRQAYQIVETVIEWLPEDRQKKIIEAIPLEHQPIFWWLKYHLRRPAEAMALRKEDLNDGVYTVRRSVSAKIHVDRTKTGEIHFIPMVSVFLPYAEIERSKQITNGIISPLMFTHPNSRVKGKAYTHGTLHSLWENACRLCGESISLYAGLKHSSCSQLINQYGYSVSEVQMATDHARIESVKKYAKIEVSARKSILEKSVIHFRTFSERNSEQK